MRTIAKWAAAVVGASIAGLVVFRRRTLGRNAAEFDRRYH